MRSVRVVLVAALGAAGAGLAQPAGEAEPEESTERPAFVLRIDGRDLFFDLGRATGAGPGDRVRVLRTVRALHPLTQAAIEDTFVVGEVQVAEAGAVLSRAQPDPELLRRLRVGDRVELASKVPDPRWPRPKLEVLGETPSAPAACSPSSASPEAQDALGFREAWMKAQELSPNLRAHHFKKWLQENPKTAVTGALQREIAALEAVPASAQQGTARDKPAHAPSPPKVIAPGVGFAGDPIEVVLSFGDPTINGAPKAATLNWRPRGEPLYRAVSFAPDGGSLWRARLPSEASRAPGVDYFVEMVGPRGTERSVTGDGEHPLVVEVQKFPGVDDSLRKERSRTGLVVDFVDWNHLKGNDQHWNVEGEFLYRVLGPLHSVRMGFGVYQGWGESLSNELFDERNAGTGGVQYRSRRVGYNYGFTELEFHPVDWIGVMSKLLSGVNRDGFLMGVAGALRIGREQGTSLTLSSGFTPGIGNRNEISLAWDAVRGWPMSASVIVSNEPVQADYGVRFVYQIGRRVTDWLDLSLRGSYQLRDINHSGFGLGLAQSFHW
jgi:hypothetical protein